MERLLEKIHWVFDEMVLMQRIDRAFHIEELQRLIGRVIYSDLPDDVSEDYLRMINNKIATLKETK